MAVAKVSERWQAMSLLGKEDLGGVIDALARHYRVIGPKEKGKAFVLDVLADGRELRLDYPTSILPPRKALVRPREPMFSFSEDRVEEMREAGPQVLFGLHPCDVHALALLDRVFTLEYEDPYYAARREQTYIVALNCITVGENCFCYLMGTGPALREGYDLLLTDLGDAYLVEVGSDRGQELLGRLNLRQAPRVLMAEKQRRLKEVRAPLRYEVEAGQIRELLAGGYNHPAWEEVARECLGCGNCTMVCPTCFCFQVKDQLELDLKRGLRVREWDSCLLWDYAVVALGHNFRPQLAARLKQRLYHKLYYYEEQVGAAGCVGCGRCVTNCPAGIHPLEVVARLKGE